MLNLQNTKKNWPHYFFKRVNGETTINVNQFESYENITISEEISKSLHANIVLIMILGIILSFIGQLNMEKVSEYIGFLQKS